MTSEKNLPADTPTAQVVNLNNSVVGRDIPQPQSFAGAQTAYQEALNELLDAVTQKPNTPFTKMLRAIVEARFEYLCTFVRGAS